MYNKIVANQVGISEKSETKILETLFINDHSVHICRRTICNYFPDEICKCAETRKHRRTEPIT